MIEFHDVTKIYGTGGTAVRAVDRLTFTMPTGAFWSVMGPSGSGKSTVLHLIAGLTPPTSGEVLVDGENVGTMNDGRRADLRRQRVGYVLQSFNLIPFLTAAENVGAPLTIDRIAQREIDERVKRALALVGMSHRAAHKPTEMSGGEQQRISIARALAIDPSIILADEPTGNLDRATGRTVMDLICEVNEATGVTVLLVTHDTTYGAMAQRVLRLVDGSIDQEMSLSV